jgi:hypothetical protein
MATATLLVQCAIYAALETRSVRDRTDRAWSVPLEKGSAAQVQENSRYPTSGVLTAVAELKGKADKGTNHEFKGMSALVWPTPSRRT